MPDYPTREFIVRETDYPDATRQEVVGELVRCEDCGRYDGRPCGLVSWYNTADDFCSRPERKPK